MAIPEVKEKGRVEAVAGTADDTDRIQKAIDAVSAMPMGTDGIRGALMLAKGTYRVEGTLKIHAGGVVLRGEGQEETILMATGAVQRSFIQVRGGGVADRVGV